MLVRFPQKLYFAIGFTVFFLFSGAVAYGQHATFIDADLHPEDHHIAISQKLVYRNHSDTPLDTLYLNDWNNAYASNETALARRFREEFKKNLHLAKDKDRGFTIITSIVTKDYQGVQWRRPDQEDMLQIILPRTLLPGDSMELYFSYIVDLPNSKFTDYGHGYLDGYYLKDWYLTPAVYDGGQWIRYSNKDINDLHMAIMDTEIRFQYPDNMYLASNFGTSDTTEEITYCKTATLIGTARKDCEIVLTPTKRFTAHKTGSLTVTTDMESEKYDEIARGISINRVSDFILENLGDYPHDNLLVTESDYSKNPFYGPNLLPSFIRPYTEQFQFEMKFLKTALNQFVEESIYLDKRKERWVYDGIVVYLMIKYVEENYPDQKLTGKLSKTWGFRSYNLAQMDFNDQYYLFQMAAVRRNDHQSLSTSNDALTRWNNKIANSYKAGLGLSYLGEYIGYGAVDRAIKEFYKESSAVSTVKATLFEDILSKQSQKDIGWFFHEYVAERTNIDFKIKKVETDQDSIHVEIKNKTGSNVPVSLFGLRNDSIVSKYWFTGIDSSKTYAIPNKGESRLVLNYDKKIPEVNQRDNWKSLKGFLSSNKKLQLRFFKDTENPYYNQLFFFPEFRFNVNNGIIAGLTLDNRTLVNRNIVFTLKPQYSSRENALIGQANFLKRHFFNTGKLNAFNYGLSYSNSFFDEGSRVSTLTPFINLNWRPEDFISNRRQFLNFRYRNVFRNIAPSVINQIDTDPDFSVFNLRYGDVDNNITNFKSWIADAQLAGNFSKLSLEWEQRILFPSNRQLNLRVYGGKFIHNDSNSDFFSFALDRPTDYLFDLNYLDRSTDAMGLARQQFLLAEGGFKSIFDDRFGNDWILTGNLSFNLWQWVEVYGDIGGIRNKGESARFVYDSGIRLNLVTDFFELYFPVYSNNGYEIAQPNYGERIRYVITISPRTLIGLFTRKWF